MQNIYRILSKVIDTDFNILIEGKSGTGKNLIAKVLHDFGTRRDKCFLSVNLSIMSLKELQDIFLENFEGQSDKIVGTLFLDEIGDMPLPLQAKLLRALENRTIQRVGGGNEVEVDFRLVCATHQNIEGDIESGKFRADLF